MRRILGRALFFALLLASLAPVRAPAADPLLMFLLGIARDMVINHAMRPRERAAIPELDLSRVYQGTLVEPEHVRRLIDECFTYLSDAQRGEIFESLNAALLLPKNAAVRAPMIEFFTERALVVRATQRRLAQMSPREKQRLVAEFRAQTAGMPPEEQSQLSELLRNGLLPLPEDLNQQLLAALDR